MRAGPLSNAGIIDRLNEDFVSAWILRKDLIALSTKKDSDLGKFAAKVLEYYAYPVDSLVFSAKQAFLGNHPSHQPGSRSVKRYHEFLDKARRP